jgi:tetratricopeptide (TPR) repeat protein
MINNKSLTRGIITLALVVLLVLPVAAQQNLTQPRASQHASVSQRVGLTDITIDYHRPGVLDRDIWGALVPYDQIWRAGANENTTITFSTQVSIKGNSVPAGTYGLHMIPTKSDWTIILSKDYEAWGSFFYKEENDELRFSTTPASARFEEWLSYSFTNVSANSATLTLRWEKLEVPFTIDVDVNNIVSEKMQTQLTSLAGFGWQGWNQIATYYYINSMDMNEALGYVDRSIQINQNVTNSFTKAIILESMGDIETAAKLKEEGFQNATENNINTLGYQFLFAGKIDKAVEIFKKNVELYPDSWNVYDSLGECYAAAGDEGQAHKYYTIALEKAPDNQKQRITGVLDNLKGS